MEILISIITEMKILLEGLNSRFELAEERSHKLKDRLIDFIQSGEQRKKEYRKINRASEKCGISLNTPTCT